MATIFTTANGHRIIQFIDHVGKRQAAARIESVVEELLSSGRVPSLQAGVMRTSEVGDLVADAVKASQPARVG